MHFELSVSDSVHANYGAWRQLWLRTQGGCFLHPGWHAAFVESKGSAIRPQLLLVVGEGRLVGVLPLRRDPGGVLRFLTAPRSDYEDLLVDDGHEAEVVPLVAAFLQGQRFELREVPEASELARVLRQQGLRAQPASRCPGIHLSAETVRDVTGRKSLKRHQSKLGRRGVVRLESIPAESRDLALHRLAAQHVSRWLAADQESLFLDESQRSFYSRLLHRPDFSEFGACHVLRAGDLDAAYHIGLVSGPCFVWYKPTFNMNVDADGPGEVLFRLLVEHAWATGKTYFDFSRGEEAFKLRFATVVRQNLRFSNGLPLPGRLLDFVRRAQRKIGRSILAKRDEVVWWAALRRGAIRRSVPAPDVRPVPPQGYLADFIEADLNVLSSIRLASNRYASPQRMRDAIARRRRGDRMLIIRRIGEDVPVHLSWFRVLEEASEPGGAASPHCAKRWTANVYDSWTASRHRAAGIDGWAMRYLAWEAAVLGMSAFVTKGADPDRAVSGE